MNSITQQFPVLTNYTYLNTASSGLLPTSVKNWRAQHDQEFSSHASIFRESHKDHIEQIRQTVAQFCGANKYDVALIQNWSLGFNALLGGFETRRKVLLLKGDYPSINWPVENRDFECFYVEIDDTLEENILTALDNHKPDVFAFSLTQYISGITLDLEFLKTIKTLYPNMLLIADGTQYIGTRPFDFNKSPLDIVGVSAYKWLMGGYGAGFMIIKDSAKAQLFPRIIGFNSTSYLFSNREEAPFNQLLEPGHHDTLNFGTLMRSIKLLQNEGLPSIAHKIKQLRSHAVEQLLALEMINPQVENREVKSSIMSIEGSEGLFSYLSDNKIICSERGKGLRISFHYYNSIQDIDTLVEAIKKFKGY